MEYYISIALLWEGYTALENLVERQAASIPPDQELVPRSSWHCTLFAICRLDSYSDRHANETEALRVVLRKLPYQKFKEIIARRLGQSSFTAKEINYWGNATSVQMSPSGEDLSNARNEIRECIGALLEDDFDGVDVESLLFHDTKSMNNRLFGSFARRVEKIDGDFLRDQLEIEIEKEFYKNLKIQLTISDEALTNVRQEWVDYVDLSIA